MPNNLTRTVIFTVTIIAFCCIPFTSAFSQVPDYVPLDGLVGWYPFDGNAEDMSGLGNHGEIMGAQLSHDRFDFPESAFEFEHNRIEIANTAINDQFKSISFWFRSESSSENQVAFKQNVFEGPLYPRINCAINWGGNVHFAGKQTCNSNWQYDNVPLALNNGEWHHYTGVLSATEKKLFIDGVLVNSTPFQLENMCSGGDLIIGQEWVDVPYDFIGNLDDFGFWNRALSEEEVWQLYNAPAPIPGCPDPEACNYSTIANWDDGSCQYPLVPGDCEGGGVACAEGTYWNSLIQQCLPTNCPSCPGDLDGDNAVGVPDLLSFLIAFGGFCPESGCTDPQALNFEPIAEINDGSCVYPPCLDVQESGEACDDGNPNTFNTYWNEDGCLCEGSEYVAEDGSGPCEGVGTVTYQGHDYQLVEIGEQCWFAENLQAFNYTNGDGIPSHLSNDDWSATTAGAVGIYGQSAEGCGDAFTPGYSACDTLFSLENFGGLYNFYSVEDPRGLCPSDWVVASDTAWMEMEIHLGMSEEDAYSDGWRGSNQGHILKTTEFWYNSGNGIDSLGFAAAPGGYRHYSYGAYVDAGYNSDYWTSSPAANSNHGVARLLYNNQNGILRGTQNKGNGRSVRCIKSAADTCFDPDGDGICPEDEISGCTDETACNYNAEATHDDGSCIPSQEAGSSCDDGDDNTFNDAWYAETCTCTGTPAVAEDGSGPCEGALTVNYHGYDYQLVEIGEQCWFRENLRATDYSNGDTVLTGLSQTEWIETNSGAACSYADDENNIEEFGLLYNFYAASDERSLCPSGWMVAGHSDWISLEIGLGLDSVSATSEGYRGAEIALAEMLLESELNSSGFSAKFAGRRVGLTGEFADLGFHSAIFTSTPLNEYFGWYRLLSETTSWVYSGYSSPNGNNQGYSIRCIKSETDACFDPDGDGVCPEDEISGCTDETACNYNVEATHDDGSCIPSQEAGSSCDDGDDNTFNDAWDVETCDCAGTPYVDPSGLGPCEGEGIVTYHGHTYQLVEIGDQCWFAESLQSSYYANGDSIQGELTNEEWSVAAEGAQVIYNNDSTNVVIYGRLYNWYAASDPRGTCPSGWRVPSDEDLTVLTDYLGGTAISGDALKANVFGDLGDENSNSSGFGMLAGGNCSLVGYMSELGSHGYIWSTTALLDQANALTRAFLSTSEEVGAGYSNIRTGFSIRCLKFSIDSCFDPDGDGVCPEDEISGCTDETACNYNAEATHDDGSCIP